MITELGSGGRRRAGLAAGFTGAGTSESLEISIYPSLVAVVLMDGANVRVGRARADDFDVGGFLTRAFGLGTANLSARVVKSRKI